MDPIIRSASLADQPRQLRRATERNQTTANKRTETSAMLTPVAAPAPQPPKPTAAPKPPAPAPKPITGSAFMASMASPKAVPDTTARIAQQKEEQEVMAAAERRGYAVGYEKGQNEARELVREQIEYLTSIASGLAQAKFKVLQDAEDLMVEIVFSAICRLLGERALDKEIVIGMIDNVMSSTRERAMVHIHLHPQDLSLIRALAEDGELALDARISLQADSTIEIGGCIVESPTGSLDARLETQLQLTRDTLLQVRNERKDERGEGA